MPSTYIPKKRKNEAAQGPFLSSNKRRYGSPLSRSVTTTQRHKSVESAATEASEASKLLGYDDMDDDDYDDDDDDLAGNNMRGGSSNKNNSSNNNTNNDDLNDLNDDDDNDLGEFKVQDEEFGGGISKKNKNKGSGSKGLLDRKSGKKSEGNGDDGIGGALAVLGGLGIPGLGGNRADGGSAGGNGGVGGGPGSKKGKKDVERQRLLMQAFDESQMARYEAFRRANVSKGSVKKLANAVLGQSIPAPVVTALCGLSKVFIGELVETARQVQHIENRKSYYELKAIMEKEIEDEARNKYKKEDEGNRILLKSNTSDSNNAHETYKKLSSDSSQAHSASSTTSNIGGRGSNLSMSLPFLDGDLTSSSTESNLGGLDLMELSSFGLPAVNLLASASSSTTSTLADSSFNLSSFSGPNPLLDVLGLPDKLKGDDASSNTTLHTAANKGIEKPINANNPNNLVYPPFDDEEAEKAIELLDRQPLKPYHLRKAWRLYKRESGTVPEAQWRRQGGDGDGKMFR